MLLLCHQPFGNFEPGDEVEVPDGAVFDSYYFTEQALDGPESNANGLSAVEPGSGNPPEGE
jgi:hypothetical protein